MLAFFFFLIYLVVPFCSSFLFVAAMSSKFLFPLLYPLHISFVFYDCFCNRKNGTAWSGIKNGKEKRRNSYDTHTAFWVHWLWGLSLIARERCVLGGFCNCIAHTYTGIAMVETVGVLVNDIYISFFFSFPLCISLFYNYILILLQCLVSSMIIYSVNNYCSVFFYIYLLSIPFHLDVYIYYYLKSNKCSLFQSDSKPCNFPISTWVESARRLIEYNYHDNYFD